MAVGIAGKGVIKIDGAIFGRFFQRADQDLLAECRFVTVYDLQRFGEMAVEQFVRDGIEAPVEIGGAVGVSVCVDFAGADAKGLLRFGIFEGLHALEIEGNGAIIGVHTVVFREKGREFADFFLVDVDKQPSGGTSGEFGIVVEPCNPLAHGVHSGEIVRPGLDVYVFVLQRIVIDVHVQVMNHPYVALIVQSDSGDSGGVGVLDSSVLKMIVKRKRRQTRSVVGFAEAYGIGVGVFHESEL